MLEYIMILTMKNNSHLLICCHADSEADAYYKTGKWCVDRRIFPDNMQCVEVLGSIEEIL